ncbi:MAG: iron uptake porin [Candidatus Gastranaerophilales bacterium]|nr:iron uptake porin [Candidatus Gastranaerophilales bacterium]
MVVKRITPLLLAASVLIYGFTGSLPNIQSAHAITSVDELSDVSHSNWSYKALKDLVDKYNVIEGYPDKTFRGGKAPSRYELAAALNATIKTIGKEIARLGAEKADKEDLATVAKLQEEFATELKTLQARSDALEARATKIEAKSDEQDNRLAVIEKMKIYGDVSFGGYGDISGNPADSFTDGISAVGRTRINVDYAAVEDKGGPIVGPGTIHTRLVAAFGRVSPLEAGNGLATNRFSGASMIAGDSSLYNEGMRPNDFINKTDGNVRTAGIGVVSGANLRSNAYIESTYYQQILKAQMPYVPCGDTNWRTSFDLRAGVIPWREIYFQSPYQGYENDQFQNTALINNPAILQNFTVPRISAQMNQGLGKWTNVKVKVDGSFIDVSDMMNGVGLTTELDVGYNLGFLDNYFNTCNKFNVAGNIYGGYYLINSGGGGFNNLVNISTTTGTTVAPTNMGNGATAHGFYTGMNQELYKGIGLFGSFALNDTGPVAAMLSALQNGTGVNTIYNNTTITGASLIYGIRQAWTAGIEVPIRALPNFITRCKRQRDTLGFGAAFLFPNVAVGSPSVGISAANPNAGGREQVYEMYYKLQATDALAFIPSVQLIQNRAAWSSNETNVLVGFRTSYKF